MADNTRREAGSMGLVGKTAPVGSLWQSCPRKRARGTGMSIIRRKSQLLALALVLVACGGCAVPAASMISPALSSGVPVVAQGSGGGQADSFWVARYDDVVQAALRAAEKLSLDLEEKLVEDDRTTLRFADSKSKEVELVIELRTATVTRVDFDPKETVSVGMARLLGQQMAHELDDAGAFLVDWGE
jgi:hypothetical protein